MSINKSVSVNYFIILLTRVITVLAVVIWDKPENQKIHCGLLDYNKIIAIENYIVANQVNQQLLWDDNVKIQESKSNTVYVTLYIGLYPFCGAQYVAFWK